jgi:hypothetical protein
VSDGPQRIRIIKGQVLPPNTVKVGRGTRWDTPYSHFASVPLRTTRGTHIGWAQKAAQGAVQIFRYQLMTYGEWEPPATPWCTRPKKMTVEDVKRELEGKNVACQCGLDMACHGDVLLEIANGWPAAPLSIGEHQPTLALQAAIDLMKAIPRRGG